MASHKLPKSTTIRGKRYRIKNVTASWGKCDCPITKGKQLNIPVRGDTIGELTVILHEALHAAFWDIDEEVIETVGHDFARLLWNLNWRNEHENSV